MVATILWQDLAQVGSLDGSEETLTLGRGR